MRFIPSLQAGQAFGWRHFLGWRHALGTTVPR